MAFATKTKLSASEFLAWAEAAENDQRKVTKPGRKAEERMFGSQSPCILGYRNT